MMKIAALKVPPRTHECTWMTMVSHHFTDQQVAATQQFNNKRQEEEEEHCSQVNMDLNKAGFKMFKM